MGAPASRCRAARAAACPLYARRPLCALLYPSAGQLWLLGRAKDMIKSGGENVHAWEVRSRHNKQAMRMLLVTPHSPSPTPRHTLAPPNPPMWQVERALAGHPGVALAAVVGVADWRLGEAVAAVVVLRPGWRWAGERCQILLGRAGGSGPPAAGQLSAEASARSALAAAAAAVGAPGLLVDANSSSMGGSTGLPGADPEGERRSAASGGVQYTEDLRSTLLQRPQSRPGSAEGMLSPASSAGLDAFPTTMPMEVPERQPSSLRQLAVVAAGLQMVAAGAVATRQGGAAGSDRGSTCSGSAGGGGNQTGSGQDGRAVDGHVLQQHCRAAGLAGFKLPRVFLLCDAASASAPPAGSGRVVLPVNSTGKVVKHLLREAVQQHMVAAAAGSGDGSSGTRSRL